ncbi:MAG TPA: hypothetical protein VJQ26_07610 [Ktedonobacteraceae bacterium]|nr:hypothetical protein [Ktedonobacteraceae bacterium]
MNSIDSEQAVHAIPTRVGGDAHGQLQFQVAALNQQAEKFQVAHEICAIAPAGLIPLPQPEQRGDLVRVEAPPSEQVCFTQSDVRRR